MPKEDNAAAPAADTAPQAAPQMPKKIRVQSLYGYYDELNRYRSWNEGDITSDPAEIELLMGRKAPVDILEA